MNRFMIVSIVFAILAAVLHGVYIRRVKAEMTGGNRVSVIVASSNLLAGQRLEEQSLAVRRVPERFVDARTVLQEDVKTVLGLPLTVSVGEGQFLQWTDVQVRHTGGKEDLASFVESGKRAMSIVVTSELALGGLLRPGHRVDILGTFPDGEAGADAHTRVLLQNVTVLATGSQLAGDEQSAGYRTVTLSVDLEQSEILAFAQDAGDLSLVLRGSDDLTIVRDAPKTSEESFFMNSVNSVNQVNKEMETKGKNRISRLREARR